MNSSWTETPSISKRPAPSSNETKPNKITRLLRHPKKLRHLDRSSGQSHRPLRSGETPAFRSNHQTASSTITPATHPPPQPRSSTQHPATPHRSHRPPPDQAFPRPSLQPAPPANQQSSPPAPSR